MKKYARIIDGIVVELFNIPDEFAITDCFVEEIANQCVECPETITVGSTLSSTGDWTIVTDATQQAENSTQPVLQLQSSDNPVRISPIEFKLLFTAPERVAIKTAAITDDLVEDFLSIIDDARLTNVDLSLKSTIDALTYLESIQLITSDRKAEILQNTKI